MLKMGKDLLFTLVEDLRKVTTAEKSILQFITDLLANGVLLLVNLVLMVRHGDCTFTKVRLNGKWTFDLY